MKNQFPGYYDKRTPDELSKLASEAIVVLDTNVLLLLFQCGKEAADDWFTALKTFEKQLWIPHQVAQEYHHNVELIIKVQSKAKFDNILTKFGVKRTNDKKQNVVEDADTQADSEAYGSTFLKSLEDSIQQCAGLIGDYGKQLNVIAKTRSDAIEKSKQAAKDDAIAIVKKAKDAYLKHADDIKEKIAEMFDGRVGKPFGEEIFLAKCQLAEMRFKQRVPPGFGDRGKEEEEGNPYGDAILWFQMLDFAREQKRPLVFVTADSRKADWFYVDAREKIVGPKAELRAEMKAYANQEFHAYRAATFLQVANDEKHLQIRKESVAETTDIQTRPVKDLTKKPFGGLVPRIVFMPAASGDNQPFWGGDDNALFWGASDEGMRQVLYDACVPIRYASDSEPDLNALIEASDREPEYKEPDLSAPIDYSEREPDLT